MTPTQYGLLWGLFPRIPGIPTIPPYADYLSRENFLEDYLDIFRGRDTRAARGLAGPHPFHAQLSNPLFVAPKIAYVLIGEAANSSSSTFFYNPTHLSSTNWLRSPLKAFGLGIAYPKTSKEKIDALFALAMKGFLLLDLYPFALAYSSKMRAGIDYIPFWQHLVDRINGLHSVGFVQEDCLLAFSGPAKTHHQIAVQLHNQHLHGAVHRIGLPSNCTLYWGTNILTLGTTSIPPTHEKSLICQWHFPGKIFHLDGNANNPVDGSFDFFAPKYKCETWDGSYVNGPSSKFIKVAFKLP
jgi:hypothetical protein